MSCSSLRGPFALVYFLDSLFHDTVFREADRSNQALQLTAHPVRIYFFT
jgi:hypothetical protein